MKGGKKMYDEIKNGEELLDDFFENLKNIPNVDKDVVNILFELYQKNKLTHKNISNALLKNRGETANGKN